MKKLLVFSDIHMHSAGETIIGLDPFVRFQQAIHDTTHHSDALPE